jgi:TolA-binding protein
MRFPLIWTLMLATPLLAVSLPGPARAQTETREELALRNQLYELQQQVQALQQQVGRGGSYLGSGYSSPPPSQGGSGDMVAQLLVRVQALEEQVRNLRGQIADLQNQVSHQGADLGKRIDDLAFQVQNGQPGGAVIPGPGAPQPGMPQTGALQTGAPQPGAPVTVGVPAGPVPGGPTPLLPQPGVAPNPPPGAAGPAAAATPPAAPVRRTPELAIQEANAALARRDYPAAEAASREVLNNFRTSPRAYDAQFLLAEALVGERQYPSAAIAYDDTYNRNRKGVHAPEALFGLANALTAIGEKRAACDTLAKLHAEFPQIRPELRDNIAVIRQRAGCH